MELINVTRISKFEDTDKKSVRIIIKSYFKAIAIVGLLFIFDFNVYLISAIVIYHLANFYILKSEINIIRAYLGAYYEDLVNHKD